MKKVGEKLIPKTEDEFDAEDIKKVENYAKAINMLYCAINPDDYRKISCYSTAKEMWDKLEVTYEGTDQVREAKIDFLTQEYEMFRMKEHEKIDDMFDRFSKIVNDLHALKKTYTDRDLVRKILRSLKSEWRSKADAIYESIGTSNVTIDGLRGNLKTYESTILNPSLNDQMKGIALKAFKEPSINDTSDDDEVKLVMKKLCKLLRKKEKVEDGPVCYGCGEAGHIKNKCPRSRRNAHHFKKQRAYISWGGDSGDESSEQEEDEEANLCLKAQEEEESANDENQEVCNSSTVSYSLEEMQEALQELYDEFVSASKTNKALKKRFSNLETDLEKLQKENEKLKEENKFYVAPSLDRHLFADRPPLPTPVARRRKPAAIIAVQLEQPASGVALPQPRRTSQQRPYRRRKPVAAQRRRCFLRHLSLPHRRRIAAPPRRAPDVASTAGVLPRRRAQRRQSPPAAVAELPSVVSPSPAVRRQSLPSAADDDSPRRSAGRRLHCRRPSPPSIAAPPVAVHRRRAAAPPLSPASVTVAASGRCPELISPAD
ncbi:unnamed protein product [Cuscuta campestris]|uniref:CCHC-type domain-containing protein n=1 Tax=Cuscuta campestris TaxID=132261 RepID=A0A484KBB2_9ASTE|nr:unnamed protein product [Cuscuta campestris]